MTSLTRFAQAGAAAVVAALAALRGRDSRYRPGDLRGRRLLDACIEAALVTPTASSASVEIGTSVRASVTVAVAEVGAPLGLAAGTPAGHRDRAALRDAPDRARPGPRARRRPTGSSSAPATSRDTSRRGRGRSRRAR